MVIVLGALLGGAYAEREPFAGPEFAIEPQFDYAGTFREGLAVVKVGGEIDGLYGYINMSGDFVIEPQFDDARICSEGVCTVRVRDKWGYKKTRSNKHSSSGARSYFYSLLTTIPQP